MMSPKVKCCVPGRYRLPAPSRNFMIAARPSFVPASGSVPCTDHRASGAKLSAIAVTSPAVSAAR